MFVKFTVPGEPWRHPTAEGRRPTDPTEEHHGSGTVRRLVQELRGRGRTASLARQILLLQLLLL
ncbi:MAG TPA: hypothetical protein VF635_15365, partial [Propionibacteriaceae bacterium]